MAGDKKSRIVTYDLHEIDRFKLRLNLDSLGSEAYIALELKYDDSSLKIDDYVDKGDEENPDRTLPAQGCFKMEKTLSVTQGWSKGAAVYLEWNKDKEYELKVTVDALSNYDKLICTIFSVLLVAGGVAAGVNIAGGRTLFGKGWIAMCAGVLAGGIGGFLAGLIIAGIFISATVSKETLEKNDQFAEEVKGVILPVIEAKLGAPIETREI